MSNETFEPLVLKVSARAVEHQNAIIMQTIQHIGGNQYMDITIDRNKVLEALADYVEKCRRADRETVTDKQQINELERLAQLIGEGERSLWGKSVGRMNGARRALAAYLLDHGVIVTPCVAMVEQFIKDGKFDSKRVAHNGKYAVVYVDKSKWGCPLIDITEQAYNDEKANERIQALKGGDER